MPIRERQVMAMALAALALGCGAQSSEAPPERPDPSAARAPVETDRENGFGEGFVVWESNRSGRWRIWIRDLAGGEPRQLSPDEGRNLHCCPHISPAGERVVYLSLGPDQEGYPSGGAVGAMRWIRPDGSDLETLLAAARNYYENRAAVWQTESRLIHIQEDGRTAVLDLDTRTSTLLTTEPDPHGPWLINPPLTWAASGNGALVPYLESRRKVAARSPNPGCQPYFSQDGRWAFWVVAPGGPIDLLDLASETRRTWLKKSDSRLPDEYGYLYFPMLSADAHLLAFAASDDDHPHFEADYEVFLAETDPQTLEILGEPWRFTRHPATDRFPDVHLDPLPLGRRYGEAPFRWSADPGEPTVAWTWTYGDGSSSTGAVGEHVYDRPGRYRVRAAAEGRALDGLVSVAAAAAPRILSTRLRRGSSEIVIAFDEAVDNAAMTAQLQSGVAIDSHRLEDGDRRLVLQLASPLRTEDVLRLGGIVDRTPAANRLDEVEIAIEPPLWPSSRQGLAFLWESGDSPNLILDPVLGAETAVNLTARGPARFDHAFAMQPAGGRFEVTDSVSDRVCNECKKTYEMTLEMVMAPAERTTRRGVILTSASKSRRNFSLEQRDEGLYLGLRMKSRGDEAFPRAFLTELPPEGRFHLVVTYRPGRVETYIEGRLQTVESSISGGFFHWRPAPLVFGSDWNGRDPWRGTLEGVAIYSRALSAEEVQESFSRYRSKLQARPSLRSWTVRGRLISCSDRPTLEEIDPYREALVTCRLRVEEAIAGEELSETLWVAQWSIMDGRPIPLDPPGTSVELELSLLTDNPQLESVYLSDTLEPAAEGPLYYLHRP